MLAPYHKFKHKRRGARVHDEVGRNLSLNDEEEEEEEARLLVL